MNQNNKLQQPSLYDIYYDDSNVISEQEAKDSMSKFYRSQKLETIASIALKLSLKERE